MLGLIADGGGRIGVRRRSPRTPAPATPAPTVSPVDAATAGNVAGRITFEGTPPKPGVVRMDSDPNCVQPGAASTDETVLVGDAGALQNVFVYVKDGLGNLRFPVPSAAVVLDQKGCHYVPHVLGVQVGQSVEIVNSDPTLHNVHALAKANQEFNQGQPLPGMKFTRQFSTREVMVPFKCDVHPWMHAWVGVLDHPYFAVTGRGRYLQPEGAAARHLHRRGLARNTGHADAERHDRREGIKGHRVYLQGLSTPRDMLLHLFALLVAASTALLIFAGGLVTSTGSGLSVPDWPTTYGWFMLTFPLEKMVGGIFYEHSHRLIASGVGVLIVVLAVWLWKAEPRAWVRRLGYVALAAVVTQGILGGITVLWFLPDAVSIAHAGLAQLVFCLTVSIALVTSPGWRRAYAGRPGPRRDVLDDCDAAHAIAAVTTAAIYVQIIVGATMRHTGAGLAIPDFPWPSAGSSRRCGTGRSRSTTRTVSARSSSRRWCSRRSATCSTTTVARRTAAPVPAAGGPRGDPGDARRADGAERKALHHQLAARGHRGDGPRHVARADAAGVPRAVGRAGGTRPSTPGAAA